MKHIFKLKKLLLYINGVEKIKVNVPDLYIKIFDIKYEIKIKNQLSDNRIIFFCLRKNLEIMDNKKVNEFFVDTTFKIIPSKYRPYKLFVICGICVDDKIPKIFSMVLTKYTDNILYSKIFDYLYTNYNFQPKIIHSDFESSLIQAINENENINKELIHARYFFHFSNMIIKKLSKSGLIKKIK